MSPNSPSQEERRYFPRIPYRSHAVLTTPFQRWPAHVLDLSYSGALIALIHKHNLRKGETLLLTILLDEDITIKMQGKVMHQKGHFIGIECRATNIDNQKRLQALLELYRGRMGIKGRSLQVRQVNEDDGAPTASRP